MAKEKKERKAIGRPRHYKSPEDFEKKVHEYADYCKASGEPVTWTGLALFMGFCGRKEIDEYLNYDGFSHCVKKAKTFVEWHYEMRLCGDKPTGAIFALKNFGWIDKVEVENTGADMTETLNRLIDKLPG